MILRAYYMDASYPAKWVEKQKFKRVLSHGAIFHLQHIMGNKQ